MAIGVSCSSDDDTADFKTSCKCRIEYLEGDRVVPTNITDCSYDGRYMNPVIGPVYVCE